MDLASACINEQLKLDKEWKKANLTAIICMGGTPGITNIFVRYAAEGLDEVDGIRIIVRGRDNRRTEELIPAWSAG